MIERVSATWIAMIIRWLKPKRDELAILAWKRARRALRSRPGRFVRSIPSKIKLWDEV